LSQQWLHKSKERNKHKQKRLFFHNEPCMIEKLIKFKTPTDVKPPIFFCFKILFKYCIVKNTALKIKN